MDDEPIKLSDKTAVGLPLKNLVGLLIVASLATSAFFSVDQRINEINIRVTLAQSRLDKVADFTEQLERGNVSTSASQEAFLILEHLTRQLDELSVAVSKATSERNHVVSQNQVQELSLAFLQKRIDTIEEKLERSVDGLRTNILKIERTSESP